MRCRSRSSSTARRCPRSTSAPCGILNAWPSLSHWGSCCGARWSNATPCSMTSWIGLCAGAIPASFGERSTVGKRAELQVARAGPPLFPEPTDEMVNLRQICCGCCDCTPIGGVRPEGAAEREVSSPPSSCETFRLGFRRGKLGGISRGGRSPPTARRLMQMSSWGRVRSVRGWVVCVCLFGALYRELEDLC